MSQTAPEPSPGDTASPSAPAVRSEPDGTASGSATVSRWRRIAVIAIVVSFSITALVGILSLLVGSLGDVQWRILSTTSLVGTFSVLALCHLAVVAGAYRWIAAAGLLVSALALLIGLGMIWAPDDWGFRSTLGWQSFGITAILAVSAAHANLLLILGRRRRAVVRIGLWVTIGLIALLATLLVLEIATEWGISSDGFTRLIGTVAILDVLGTVVVPVLAIFLRDDPASVGTPDASGTSGSAAVPVSPVTAERLDALRAGRGISRERLIEELVAAADGARRSIG
ncbi:hypothetical protein [Leifsonia sp. Leaf264]|uniref:hypothetical protein n=1 Tax=Leifsonia sp. Leaf264 TaxID=1736314 RepID=UPI0006F4F70B|nr:hypothetical protein [Leifsonia sp. Leaf264]KQO99778.1 hypothetical protein ASF30_07765 [Leifsonia sp. Leaf264]